MIYLGNTSHLEAVVNGREYTAQSYMPTVSPIESIKFKTSSNKGGVSFDVTPGNAPGNISNGTIGFFGASAVSAIEAEVK